MGTVGGVHSAIEEAARDLDRHDRAVLDVKLDQLAVLRAGLGALLAQQIAGRQVYVAVTVDDVAAEGALAGARAAQNEHYLRLPRYGGHRRGEESLTGGSNESL